MAKGMGTYCIGEVDDLLLVLVVLLAHFDGRRYEGRRGVERGGKGGKPLLRRWCGWIRSPSGYEVVCWWLGAGTND